MFYAHNGGVDLTAAAENDWKNVKTMKLPPGTYLIYGQAVAVKRGAPTLIRCRVMSGTQPGMQSTATVGEVNAPFTAGITVSATALAAQEIDVSLQCMKQYTGEPTKATYVESAAIQAIRVGERQLMP